MFRRYQTPIAVLSIALQVIDLILAVIGHQHAGETVVPASLGAAHAEQCHHRHANHGHHAHDSHEHGQSLPGHRHSPTEDDCSLCRHASQAVAPASPPLELGRPERVELLEVRLAERAAIAVIIYHEARGPPALAI